MIPIIGQKPKPSPGLFLPRSHVSRVIISEHQRRKRLAKAFAHRCTMELQKHYPEHLFVCEVDYTDGTIFIDHPLLKASGARYICHYADYERTQGKELVRLAGECLERVNLPRGELKYFEDYEGRPEELARTQFRAK